MTDAERRVATLLQAYAERLPMSDNDVQVSHEELRDRLSERDHRRARSVVFLAAVSAVAAVAVVAALVMGDGTNETAPAPPAGTPSATPTPTPTMEASLTLRGDGIAPFTFGANQVDVDAVLSARLGDPEEGEQGILCPRPGSPWVQVVNYARPDRTVASISPASGGLWVYYKAKDQSETSPRSLAGWFFHLDKQLPAPLAMQDDVPLNLTYNQLKAKYPAGKLGDLDLDAGGGGRMFTLPNKLQFVSNPDVIKPGVVLAGQGPACG